MDTCSNCQWDNEKCEYRGSLPLCQICVNEFPSTAHHNEHKLAQTLGCKRIPERIPPNDPERFFRCHRHFVCTEYGLIYAGDDGLKAHLQGRLAEPSRREASLDYLHSTKVDSQRRGDNSILDHEDRKALEHEASSNTRPIIRQPAPRLGESSGLQGRHVHSENVSLHGAADLQSSTVALSPKVTFCKRCREHKSKCRMGISGCEMCRKAKVKCVLPAEDEDLEDPSAQCSICAEEFGGKSVVLDHNRHKVTVRCKRSSAPILSNYWYYVRCGKHTRCQDLDLIFNPDFGLTLHYQSYIEDKKHQKYDLMAESPVPSAGQRSPAHSGSVDHGAFDFTGNNREQDWESGGVPISFQECDRCIRNSSTNCDRILRGCRVCTSEGKTCTYSGSSRRSATPQSHQDHSFRARAPSLSAEHHDKGPVKHVSSDHGASASPKSKDAPQLHHREYEQVILQHKQTASQSSRGPSHKENRKAASPEHGKPESPRSEAAEQLQRELHEHVEAQHKKNYIAKQWSSSRQRKR